VGVSALLRTFPLIALLLAAGAAQADDYIVTQGNSSRSPLTMRAKTLPTGQTLPYNGMVDANGNPYAPANPLYTGPAVVPGTMLDRSGKITTANTAQPVMAANTTRKAGWIEADPNNNGYLYVSLTGAASTTPGGANQCVLAPGGSCPLTLNGYVIQSAVSVAGTVAGDAFEAAELQ
jgi:hypothetical protein